MYIVQCVLKFDMYVQYNVNAESIFHFTSCERLFGDGLDCTCLSAEVSYLVGEHINFVYLTLCRVLKGQSVRNNLSHLYGQKNLHTCYG